jgi:2'-5' RNA ligase
MRCFIAAWPEDEARERCRAVIDAVRTHADHGRVMRAENLHLTFAFIGTLDDAIGARVAAACATLACEPCDLMLDAIGFFRRPRVLWAGGPAGAAVEALAQRARALLDQMQIAYDRKPFVPHVTLLRDVRRYDGPRIIEPPIAWPIAELALYRSGRDALGARYERVAPV